MSALVTRDGFINRKKFRPNRYPVSMINMKELDDLMYVKLDILGLDNIGVINETCKMLGIERLTPGSLIRTPLG